jgi:hypothetical protein
MKKAKCGQLSHMVKPWLYGSMAMDIVDLVMSTSTSEDATATTVHTV